MAKAPNERITRERIEKATAFAKKGQYQRARYMLQDVHSDPRAAKLLKQMEGRKDKFQGNVLQFFNGTVLTIVGLGIIVIIVAYNVVSNIRSEFNARGDVAAVFEARQIPGNAELYIDLVYFCYDRVGTRSESCLDWGEEVMYNYINNVRTCVIVDDNGGIQYRNQELDAVAACYMAQGIPDPTTYSVPLGEG